MNTVIDTTATPVTPNTRGHKKVGSAAEILGQLNTEGAEARLADDIRAAVQANAEEQALEASWLSRAGTYAGTTAVNVGNRVVAYATIAADTFMVTLCVFGAVIAAFAVIAGVMRLLGIQRLDGEAVTAADLLGVESVVAE